MLPRDELVAALPSLPTFPHHGVAFRLILARYLASALSTIGSLRTGGRYNGPGLFEALYLAEHPITALQEVDALVRTSAGLQPVKGPPRVLLSVEYRLERVLDILETRSHHTLGTDVDELCAPWRPDNVAGRLAPTQMLGAAILEHGTIEAIRVPSARDPTATNLVIFPERLHPRSVIHVFDESGGIDARLP